MSGSGKRSAAKRLLMPLALLAASIASAWAQTPLAQRGFNYRGDILRIPGEVSLSLKAGRYQLLREENGEVTIKMEGCGFNLEPGEPRLPLRMVEVALPPNVDWTTVGLTIIVGEVAEIPGAHKVKPAPVPRPVPGDDRLTYDSDLKLPPARNQLVFARNEPYPKEPVKLLGLSQMRKWRFVRLGFMPVRYNPVSGKLAILQEVRVKLTFKRIGREVYKTDPLLRDTLMDAEAKKRLINFEEAKEWYKYLPGPAPRPLPGAGQYVIITTNAIVDGSAILDDFIAHKTSQGHTVRLVTEDEYDGLTGQAPNGRAEKIRQWLIDNYAALGTKWVLLIGNPDPDDPANPSDSVGDLPMKMCWPNIQSTIYRESPTDYFYADLTGDWDQDGDGFFGEDVWWGTAAVPDPAVNPSTYSVRWTGRIEAAADGTYAFKVVSDEGVRIRLDGAIVLENWTAHFMTTNYFSQALTAGQHEIEIEFFNDRDDATVQLQWRPPGATDYTVIPAASLYHLDGGVHVAGGLSGQYFNNIDFTAPVLTRVDPTINFSWWRGDDGPGGVDFTPEVYVGRIPVYGGDYAALNAILQKIVDYESVTVIPAWRRNVLFGMAYLWDPCSDWRLGEAILDDYGKELRFGYYRHYEENAGVTPEASPVIGHPPDYPAHPPNPDPAAPDNMLKEWVNNTANPGYGVVIWSTHGSTSSAGGLMSSALCTHLNDDQPSFVFHGSCLNGYPESANNLGYALLKQGAIGTVSASRVSWSYCFSPPANPNSGANCDLSYHYNRRLMGGEPAGLALYRTKDEVEHDWDWMNKMDFNLYGDPTTALFEPYIVADVDFIPVLDVSGSMGSYASDALADKKIDVLKQAADQLADMLAADAGHQFGLVKFSTTASTLMNLQPFTAAARATAHTRIGGLAPSGQTSIGGGLNNALAQFAAHGAAGHRRAILLVTDGMENKTPMIASVQSALVAGNITVYPLGLGYSSGIDEAKLIGLADSTGGDYRITDDDLLFRKYFVEILGSATDWSVVTDPLYTLGGGESRTIPVAITSSDTAVIFTAYWSGKDKGIKLTLRAPDGTAYTEASPSFVGKNRYCFYRIDLDSIPAARRDGTWTMRIEGNAGTLGGQKIRASASALAKSGTRIRLRSAVSLLRTGDGVLLQVRLTDNGRPVSGATVRVHCDKPQIGFGNLMNLHKPAVPAGVSPVEPLSPLQLKTATLQKQLGKGFMPRKTGEFMLRDDGSHGDLRAGDGVYSAVFTDTTIPGLYSFRVVASNIAVGKAVTTREYTKCLHNTVAISKEASSFEIKPLAKTSSGTRYSLKVAPKDRFGNYLGPGYALEARIGGARVALKDQLDGFYLGEIYLTATQIRANQKIEIVVDGAGFASLKTG